MSEEPRPCPVCGLLEVEARGRRPNHAVYSFTCKRCGDFEINAPATAYIGQMDEQARLHVSVAVRQASAQGNPLVLDSGLIDSLSSEPPRRRSLLDGANTLLLYLADGISSHFASVVYNTLHDHTLLGFIEEQGMKDAFQALMQLDHVHRRGAGAFITIDGWKRIQELRRQQPSSRKAFVAMWFDDEMDAAWAEGFEPGIRDTEFFEPVRVLDIEHAGKIDDLIIAEIRASGLLVADFTGHRPSVYYEAGFAGGLGIPVIWCCRKDQIDDVHFDIRQYNHVVWTDPGDLREKLKNRILAVVPAATKG